MKLSDIKAMFKVGGVWIGERTPGFNGEAVTITHRTVEKVQTKDMAFRMADGKRGWSEFPKAVDVIEARDGFLHYRLSDGSAEVKLTLHGAA